MAYILVREKRVTNVFSEKPNDDHPFIEVEIPQPEKIDEKVPIMMYDGSIYYEYVDAPIEPEIVIPDDDEIPTEPTLEEKVAEQDTKIVTLEETIDVLYGGV